MIVSARWLVTQNSNISANVTRCQSMMALLHHWEFSSNRFGCLDPTNFHETCLDTGGSAQSTSASGARTTHRRPRNMVPFKAREANTCGHFFRREDVSTIAEREGIAFHYLSLEQGNMHTAEAPDGRPQHIAHVVYRERGHIHQATRQPHHNCSSQEQRKHCIYSSHSRSSSPLLFRRAVNLPARITSMINGGTSPRARKLATRQRRLVSLGHSSKGRRCSQVMPDGPLAAPFFVDRKLRQNETSSNSNGMWG